jgi:glycine dehydrogenase
MRNIEESGGSDSLKGLHIGIFEEYKQVRDGSLPSDNNMLSNAPHTMQVLMDDELDLPYSRKQACQPDDLTDYSAKYWAPVGRIDNVYGDKNLICSCPTMENYE